MEQVSAPDRCRKAPDSPDHVLADKAYTSRKNRRYLRRRGIRHTIPERLDQQRHRKNEAPRRPPHRL
ncbi:transposase [Streptomyces sp. 3211]|uniref:transposase n=1 Tax=Streptomyces sp. 3211 TaxID=1964449 RepID=UPI003FA6B1BD